MNMSELELVKLYAKAWNHLDFSIIEPYLSEDVVYSAQAVSFPEIKGKEAKNRIESRMKKRSAEDDGKVYAELGYFPSDYPSWGLEKINFHKNLWGYPCIIMARGSKDNLICPVILELKDGKIKSIYTCAVPPIQNVFRTGEYPC